MTTTSHPAPQRHPDDLLTVRQVQERFHLRDPRRARTIIHEANGFRAGGGRAPLLVRRSDLLAWEQRRRDQFSRPAAICGPQVSSVPGSVTARPAAPEGSPQTSRTPGAVQRSHRPPAQVLVSLGSGFWKPGT